MPELATLPQIGAGMAALVSALLLIGAFVRAVARQSTANALVAWQETSRAQEVRIDTMAAELVELKAERDADRATIKRLEWQIAALKAERDRDKATIHALTGERNLQGQRVRTLTARVVELERLVRQDAAPVPPTP